MNSNEATIEGTSRKSFLIRLFEGDISLAKTYWFFSVLGGLALRFLSSLVFYILFSHFYSLGRTSFSVLLYSWIAICFAYAVFMGVAVWNSATSYAKANPGHRGWAWAAKTTVVISAFVLIGSISEITGNTKLSFDDNQPETQAMISGLNANLPRKVDNVTTLDKIDIRNNTVFYYFAVTASIANQQVFETTMTRNLLEMACSDKALLSLLKSNYTIDWIYSVANSSKSITFAATKSNCPNL